MTLFLRAGGRASSAADSNSARIVPAAGEWSGGWRIVASAAVGVYVVNAHIYSLGPMMVPLQARFGWGRQDISLGLLIVTIMSVMLSPLAGMAVDRFGARRVVLPGVLIFCGGLALLSQAGPDIRTWWGLSALIGVGYAMTTTGVWVPGVATRFTRSRGLAISLCIAGAGLAAMTLPYLTTVLVQALGWREAYVSLAAFCLLVVFPVALIWFRPQDDGMAMRPAEGRHRGEGLELRGVFRSRHYWQLAGISFLSVFGLLGLIVHFVPILTDAGMNAREAAAVAGFTGLGSVLGRLAGGYLLDRIHGTIVGSAVLFIPIPVLIVLLGGPSLHFGSNPEAAAVIAFLLGLALGSETDVVAYLASRYIGLRHYGFAYGSLIGFMSMGTGIGPWLGGLIFDRQHSYHGFELLLCGCFGLVVLLIATLGAYPRFTMEDVGGG